MSSFQVEEMFSKLAVDDEFERKQVIQEISSHILGKMIYPFWYYFIRILVKFLD